jgi:hypothetical protein
MPSFVRMQSTSVYVVHSDGSGLRRVSDGPRLAGTPRWSERVHAVVLRRRQDACGQALFPALKLLNLSSTSEREA